MNRAARDAGSRQLTAAEAELINAGFQPARHARAVRLVRRVLWPFIRPFHLHTMRQIEQLRAVHAEDAQRLVQAQSRLRSELVAVVNRHAWMEERVARVEESCRPEGLFIGIGTHGIFLLKAGELISEIVRREGEWDEHVIRVAERAAAVRAGDGSRTDLIAVDAGAHFGIITVALAPLFGKVIAFEPNVFNLSLLRANVLLNGLAANVEVRCEALAESASVLSLAPSAQQDVPLPLDEQGRFSPRAAMNLGAYSFVPNGTGQNEVRATTLDALALSDVGFIKIDVQGADGLVLMGGMETIARCRPWIVFEWEDKLAPTFGVAFEDVRASRYCTVRPFNIMPAACS
jgi:FkbM family methyltransferase